MKKTFDLDAFEANCLRYTKVKDKVSELGGELNELKAQILADIEAHGAVPANAEKSRRIEIPDFVATATYGSTQVIDDAKCVELRTLLTRAGIGKLFATLFTERSEFVQAKTSAIAILSTRWPARRKAQIQAAYAACFPPPKPKAPTLTVVGR